MIFSVKEMWSTDTLRNESRLTTLKRNDGNRKREQQKESLREKIRQISSALNSNTHTKLAYDKQAEVRTPHSIWPIDYEPLTLKYK